MNKELMKLYEWLCIKRLSLNISKTNFVIFHAKNKPKSTVTIIINNKDIDKVEEVKYLGIIIDSKMTFKNHINKLKKLSRSIGVVYKLRPKSSLVFIMQLSTNFFDMELLSGETLEKLTLFRYSLVKINLFVWLHPMMVFLELPEP